MRDAKRVIKTAVIGIALLFLTTNITPIITSTILTIQQPNNTETNEETSMSSISLYLIGKTGLEKHDIMISSEDATQLYMAFEELKNQMTVNPFDEKTQQARNQFLDLLEEKNALPQGMSKEELTTLLHPPISAQAHPVRKILPFESTATEWMCTFVSEGSGTVLPIIILPRLIPILLTPIPRAFVRWNVKEGFTSCGGLRSGTGFIAYGEQKGIALGFWGIGITFSLPPIMNTYGLIGYSLYASVTADQIDHYPPNTPPEITQTDPADGEQMVPLSTTELRFSIEDLDGDLMSYNVTTQPDIGSGSGGLKLDGIYSIPISGLESLTQYIWYIQLTDGKDTIEQTRTFTTEPVAPIISNPIPTDGERDVPMDIPHLRFTLQDYQGDAMDYTVETSPDIGSAQATGVHDGTYTVNVIGLTYGATYRWYVNATDGTHWTRKIFSFETGYPSQFDPYDFGWHYRKQLTINHTYVIGDVENFPIYISSMDADLIKAQEDGGDLLFMDGAGVATRLYHELETFDQTTGTLTCWVNSELLSSTSDTILYMYYGNPTCINQQNPEKTWNNHYKAVWHLNNNPVGTIVDSTTNSNDGTSHGGMTSSDLINGKTGKCLEFDGVNDYISVPDASCLKPSDLTVIAWFRADDENLPDGNFLAKQGYDVWGNADAETYSFNVDPGNCISGIFEKNTNQQVDIIGNYPIMINSWYLLALTFDHSTRVGSFYVNGILNGEKDPCDSSVLWYNSPWDFNMGASRWGTGSETQANRFYTCGLDEVRILDTPLPSNWVSTEFNNQNNPSAFMSFRPEESGP